VSLPGDQLRARAHLNLVESSRQLFELDPEARIEAQPGWLFGAGRSRHPAISNAAFRTDDRVDPAELLERARAFFGETDRGFSLWAREGTPEDRDLIEAAEAASLEEVFSMPEMVLRRRAEERPLPEGVELRRLGRPNEAEDYWRVATAAYASVGFPPEVFAFYEDHDGLLADNVAAFLAYMDGTPVSIAMTIVSHGIAGVYWVGSLEQARGKGLGWAVTAAATNAGLDLGAEVASLQASPMGESLYAAMGYETICSYRLLMSPSP
jgi:Acetyltransferase (GNAT) domain